MDFVTHFSQIPDPRKDRKKLHKLADILFITLCAVLSGCSDWEEIEDYGVEKEDWLKKYIELPNGIPSHDTINRLFSRLKPKELQEHLLTWIDSAIEKSGQNIINIDGKRLRNSGENGSKSIIHILNAWSSNNQIILGQVKTEQKSNEITAIPELLDMLELSGAVITIDAMGCQTKIAEKITEAEADYVLAVKGNQGNLEDDIINAFSQPHAPVESEDTTIDMGHGRIEKRTCKVLTETAFISKNERWPGLQSLICIESERTDKKSGEKQSSTRYYISSLNATAQRFNEIIRNHWSIENNLHWCLDVVFKEDAGHKQAGTAAENFSMINKTALSLLKNDQSKKKSLKRKIKSCARDSDYLETVVFKP